MSTITARSRVIFERNKFGQFATSCEDAASNTALRAAHLGAAASRKLAPMGKERWRYSGRPGYVPLKDSIRVAHNGHSAEWFTIAPHGLYVEEGTSAHVIKGKLNFSWKSGKFYWNNEAYGPVGSGKPYENWDKSGAWVFHPGTEAQPYLRPAYKFTVKRQMMHIAKQEFPG